ncbi:MAG: hypothetical protein QG666_644 [Euryarchaeota archaeon]|nr:hypothetical protein [Euryarchaeota archaeon]
MTDASGKARFKLLQGGLVCILDNFLVDFLVVSPIRVVDFRNN